MVFYKAKMLSSLILLAALLIAGFRLLAKDPVPRFEEFSGLERFAGPPAPVRLPRRLPPRARRPIREKAPEGPNFAGHFTVVTWCCGTHCEGLGIINAKTGRVYLAPFVISNGLRYRLDSRLLIADPIDRATVEGYGGEIPDWLVTRYYKWDGKRLVAIAATKSILEDQ